MRVLALVPYPYDKAPGQRFRMEQWAAPLKQLGVETTFEAFRGEEMHSLFSSPGKTWRKILLTSRALANRLKVLKRIKDFDVVYIYNEATMIGPALIENYLGAKRVPLVFDFDDAIFSPSRDTGPFNRYFRLLKFPGKTKTICLRASHVIAGNAYLAGYATRFNPHVSIVPTTIDTTKYTVTKSEFQTDPPVIGWSGSYSTVQHLDSLRRALQRLARSERFRLRVIGKSDYQLDGVEVEALPWNSETEVADLRAMNIGIMPLPDNEWTRGKCGLKALQYMALAIPTVYSPVGVNTTIIRDNQNGLLATTEDQWVEQLTRLLHDSSLRRRLAMAGRATVEAEYSMSKHAPSVYQLFKAAIQRCKAEESPAELYPKIESVETSPTQD